MMTQYSKETAYKFLRSKIKQIERVERKWEKEEHYKDTIIAITLRRKFDGQEGVCRLIQSYL